jgi:hypothetical protein
VKVAVPDLGVVQAAVVSRRCRKKSWLSVKRSAKKPKIARENRSRSQNNRAELNTPATGKLANRKRTTSWRAQSFLQKRKATNGGIISKRVSAAVELRREMEERFDRAYSAVREILQSDNYLS